MTAESNIPTAGASAPRLRFAPSPTGYLHVGGARTALFNWLYARKYGGQFLLRVEDTDRARSTEASTRGIFEGLEWLGLLWDEAVVYQGANLARHQADARRLLANGHAYRCFCTPAELEDRRKASPNDSFKYDRRCLALDAAEVDRRAAAGEPFVLRFQVPEGDTSWDDLVHGPITFPNKDIEDFVILRSDATPIYNMAVVSDDIAMRITLVMRGDDHISNTPKQIMLYQALGAWVPGFAHLPMIHGLDGKKLSKRHGATAVGDYQHLGILPQAMLNFLALLGWSPGGDREIMTVPEMIELFSTEGLLKKAAIFDPKKLEWMNGQHLSMTASADLAPRVTAALEVAGLATGQDLENRRDWFLGLLDLLKVRSRTIDDIVNLAKPYLSDSVDYDPDVVAKQWKDKTAVLGVLEAVRAAADSVSTWEPEALEGALRQVAEHQSSTPGKIYQPLRVALTGSAISPGIFDVLVTLGRNRSLARIDAAIRKLEGDDPARDEKA